VSLDESTKLLDKAIEKGP